MAGKVDMQACETLSSGLQERFWPKNAPRSNLIVTEFPKICGGGGGGGGGREGGERSQDLLTVLCSHMHY